MKGCRLQPKMHPFTMWFNNKYKWLKRTSKDGNLKVQILLLKWWRAINNDLYQQFSNNSNTDYEWRGKFHSKYNVNSIHILQNICKCVAENTCARIFLWQLNFPSKSCSNDGKLAFSCKNLQKITLMSKITQCQISLSSSICMVHVISSILLTCHSSFSAVQIFSLLSLCCFFFLN